MECRLPRRKKLPEPPAKNGGEKSLCQLCSEVHIGLKPELRLFADMIIKHGNVTKANRLAGYTDNNRNAHTRKKHPAVACYLAHRLKARAEESEAGVDFVMRGLKRVADCDPAEFYDEKGGLKKVTELPERVRKALTWGLHNGLVDYRISDRMRALELLGKTNRMFETVIVVEDARERRDALAEGRKRAALPDPDVVDVDEVSA